MKICKEILIIASVLCSAAVMAKPNTIFLQPVLSVVSANGMTRILGNMPLPPDVPEAHKQRNAVVFPTASDTLGCAKLAQTAKNSGKSFLITGEDPTIYAVQGVFTLEFSAPTNCEIR